MITRLAAGRLIPKDPARVEISTHCTSVLVGSLNASTRSCLAFADVCPSSLYQSLPGIQYPPLLCRCDRFAKKVSIRSSVCKLWLNTSALSPLADAIERILRRRTILPLNSTTSRACPSIMSFHQPDLSISSNSPVALTVDDIRHPFPVLLFTSAESTAPVEGIVMLTYKHAYRRKRKRSHVAEYCCCCTCGRSSR